MRKLLDETLHDVRFLRSHQLQPGWYKALKVFILVGVLAASYYLWGLPRTVVLAAVFLALSFVVHMVYRAKTQKFTQSWLDFRMVEEAGQRKATSIGPHYYVAILLNALIAAFVSGVLV